MPFIQILQGNKRSVTGLFLMGVAPLFFSSLVTALILNQYSFLQGLTVGNWSVVFGVSILTMALALTPSTFIAVVSGFFLGWQATLMMLPAYMLASLLGYFLGLYLDGGRLLESVKEQPKVRRALLNLNKSKWKLMFLVRLSPVLPFALMNVLMPAIKMPLKVFLVAGFFGMLPRTLLSIWAGSQAADLLSTLHGQGSSSELIVVSLLTIVTIAGLVQILVKAFRSSIA